MGVVYHARYLFWFDMARTEHLRSTGLSYRELEESGYFLIVSEAQLRYLRPARYDDLVRVRCWISDQASRRVTFGYLVELADGGDPLVTGTTSLLALDQNFRPARLPLDVLARLLPVPDSVTP